MKIAPSTYYDTVARRPGGREIRDEDLKPQIAGSTSRRRGVWRPEGVVAAEMGIDPGGPLHRGGVDNRDGSGRCSLRCNQKDQNRIGGRNELVIWMAVECPVVEGDRPIHH